MNWFVESTTGSTGSPLTFIVSPKEKACNLANWYRMFFKAGYNPFFGKTLATPSSHSETDNNKTFLQKFGVLRRTNIYTSMSEMDCINKINDYKPDMIQIGNAKLVQICLYCKKNGIKLHNPKFYCPTGENIDNNKKDLFFSVLGDSMIDTYGSAETGSIMAKYFDDDKYIINEDIFVVNVLDENGNHTEDGSIAVTPLYMKGFPLINYALGDNVVIEKNSGRKYIKEISGRTNDYIKYKDGSFAYYFNVRPAFSDCKDIIQLRLIQKSYDELYIKCVKNADSIRLNEDIEEELNNEFSKRLKYHFNISYEWVDKLEPDKNGKFKVMICEI